MSEMRICRHYDWSGYLEKCGVHVTHLTGGKWKAAGNDAEPLTDEVKAYLQQPIDELHRLFRADVAAHMPVDAAAPETWGDGQLFLASQARERGLVMGIVPDMDALVALINTKEKPMDRVEFASGHPELPAQIEADAKKQGAQSMWDRAIRSFSMTSESVRLGTGRRSGMASYSVSQRRIVPMRSSNRRSRVVP